MLSGCCILCECNWVSLSDMVDVANIPCYQYPCQVCMKLMSLVSDVAQ